jgi:uroporphyrinogen decarboxylase
LRNPGTRAISYFLSIVLPTGGSRFVPAGRIRRNLTVNGRERVLSALGLRIPDVVPVFEWSIDAKVVEALSGGTDVLDAIECLDLDGVVVRPDYNSRVLSAEEYLDEWGARRKKSGEYISLITVPPLADIGDYKDYVFPEPDAACRFETLQRAVERFGSRKAVILSIRDVFSDIRDIVGYENALIALLTRREQYDGLLRRCIEYNLAMARTARKRYGIEVVVTTDDIADNRGLLFNPSIFFEFIGPRFREIIGGLKGLGLYCIKHTDGDITGILDYLVESGIDCIDPIDPTAGMKLERIKAEYGSRVCIKGNVDCTSTLVSGSAREVEDAVRDCIRKASRGGGYILSSSNSIHSGVAPGNFRTMVESAHRYGRYPIGGTGYSE